MGFKTDGYCFLHPHNSTKKKDIIDWRKKKTLQVTTVLHIDIYTKSPTRYTGTRNYITRIFQNKKQRKQR